VRAEPFELVEPTSYAGLLAAAREHAEDGKLLAGGQSLLAMMNLRLLRPAVLVATGDLLRGEILIENGDLVIPAGTRHAELIQSEPVRRWFPSIAEAARHIGNTRVRNRGTIGGSLAHADATAELPCVLAALGARVVVASVNGEREIAADRFIVSWFTSVLGPDEIVRSVRVPLRRCRQAFAEFARRSGDFALVEASVAIDLGLDGGVERARVVLGGIGDRPAVFDAEPTAALTRERDPSRAGMAAATAISASIDPRDDHRASAAYRRELASVLVRAAIATALSRGAP
jgi:carbon-monoxide dehydrogenase medium subunit